MITIDEMLDPDRQRELRKLDRGTQVPTIWDSRYTSFAAPLTSTTKAAKVMAAHLDKLAIIQPPDFPVDASIWDDIAEWHAPGYVSAIKTGFPRALATSQGFTWSPAFAESVARIWVGQDVAHRLAYILGRPILHPVSGAHHAHPSSGSGFCTFNYAYAALQKIAERRPQARLAVIDLDAHYGDGTLAFADRRRGADVFVFDIHGAVQTRTRILRPSQRWLFGAKDAQGYAQALTFLPRFLDEYEITDAVYLAGMDPYHLDEVGGIPGMTEQALADRDRFVLQMLVSHGVSTVVNFAGGYVADKVTALHGLTIDAMQEVSNR